VAREELYSMVKKTLYTGYLSVVEKNKPVPTVSKPAKSI
jgi:hypothetical protein